MSNQELAKILSEMAALLDMKEEPFKSRAYERAAFSIESLGSGVDDIYKKGGLKGLESIPGVGRGIAEKIEEYIKSGQIDEYDKLKKEIPVDVSGLNRIEGIGPKTIKKLYKELDIKNIAGLEAAARHGRIRKLEGLGEKTEERILKAIGFLQRSHGRYLIGTILPIAEKMLAFLRSLSSVERAEFAGSVRRMAETIGDLDFLVVSNKPEDVMDRFVKMPEVNDIIERGHTRASVRLDIGVDADVRILSPESFGAALQYFTGDKYHNIAVREIAIKKGYKLNEYGLFKGEKNIAAATEEEIYAALGMKWMPPEIRSNQGEIEASLKDELPTLIGYNDLKGDLQVQTDWSDGENTIEEMAEAAKKEGLEYIAITDHTKTLGVAHGLDEKRLEDQMAKIDKLNEKIDGIKILKGAEVNILKDGKLDIDDGTLAKLDVVGASVHSHFNLSETEMTERMVRAMNNPNIDLIFHPTGRIIQKREPYKIDMDKIIDMAKTTRTVLEIDAFPDRLDLKDEHIRRSVTAGVKMSIDTDAHAAPHLKYLKYGIGQARRGWAEKKDIINSRPWREMLKMLKSR